MLPTDTTFFKVFEDCPGGTMLNTKAMHVCMGLCLLICLDRSSAQTESRFTPAVGRKMAVLDFEQEGSIANSKMSVFAADELTVALYIKRNFNVLDRAHVRAVMGDKSISSAKISNQQLRKLGETVGAELIVLGKIASLNEGTIVAGGGEKISIEITVRVLSAADGAVVGMVQRRIREKGALEALVRDSVWKIAEEIKLR
jgi:hypothetical protein